jgi:hypothetical protein
MGDSAGSLGTSRSIDGRLTHLQSKTGASQDKGRGWRQEVIVRYKSAERTIVNISTEHNRITLIDLPIPDPRNERNDTANIRCKSTYNGVRR